MVGGVEQGRSKQQDLQWGHQAQGPQGPSSGVNAHRIAYISAFSALEAISLKSHGAGVGGGGRGGAVVGGVEGTERTGVQKQWEEGHCSIPNPHTPENFPF